jgi:hypothetical protein
MQENLCEAEAKANALNDDNEQLRAQVVKKNKKRSKRTNSAACQCTILESALDVNDTRATCGVAARGGKSTLLEVMPGSFQMPTVQRHVDHTLWQHGSAGTQVCCAGN